MSDAAELALLESVPDGLLHRRGRGVPAASGDTLQVSDPATGEVIKTDRRRRRRGRRRRAGCGRRAAGRLGRPPRLGSARRCCAAPSTCSGSARDDFALLMTLEMGKPLAEAQAEVTYGGEFLRWFSEEAVRIAGRYGTNPEGTGRMIVTPAPGRALLPDHAVELPAGHGDAQDRAGAGRGLHGGGQAGRADAADDARTWPSCCAEAGLPDGVVNVVTTSTSGDVSAPIIADPRLRKLQLHRLDPGRAARCSSRRPTACCAPRWSWAATRRSWSSTTPTSTPPSRARCWPSSATSARPAPRPTGSSCTRAVAEEFAARVTARGPRLPGRPGNRGGRPDRPADRRPGRRRKAEALVADAVERGAEVRTGGHAVERPGTFYAPTVVTGVRPGSDILREEIFGPVLAIVTFGDEDEAVALANDTEYGLVSYAYTRDLDRGQRLVDRLRDRHDGAQRRGRSPTRPRRSAGSSSPASAARAGSRASTSTSRPSTR